MMTSSFLAGLVAAAALGSALIGGFFFAFSFVVM